MVSSLHPHSHTLQRVRSCQIRHSQLSFPRGPLSLLLIFIVYPSIHFHKYTFPFLRKLYFLYFSVINICVTLTFLGFSEDISGRNNDFQILPLIMVVIVVVLLYACVNAYVQACLPVFVCVHADHRLTLICLP